MAEARRRVRGLRGLADEVEACRRCPRLVRWREEVARAKVRRFAGEDYWGKPVPGFGDPAARLLLVGLAPAAHGGNRTGRMFTGDESGRWLFRALHRAGFASQPESVHRADGLRLTDCYVSAAARCAPPHNRPTTGELASCRSFLLRELELLQEVRVVVGLGRVGFEAAWEAYRALGRVAGVRRPPFGHAVQVAAGGITFLASFHPSQQNTFTGRLTRPMFDRIFRLARRAIARG